MFQNGFKTKEKVYLCSLMRCFIGGIEIEIKKMKIFLQIDLLEKWGEFSPKAVIKIEKMMNMLSWSNLRNLKLIKVGWQMIRKIILIMEMIMNIPKLLMRFYEKKNSKLLMQRLMRTITSNLEQLIWNTVVLKNDMEINKERRDS